MTPEYIAGLFDGEGCVSLFLRHEDRGKYRYQRWVLDVRIAMTNGDEPLHLIHARYGGGIHTESIGRTPSHKPKTQWWLRESAAFSFLFDMQPHCMVKRREIELALEYLRVRYGRVVPDDAQEIYARIAVKMRRDKPLNTGFPNRLRRLPFPT